MSIITKVFSELTELNQFANQKLYQSFPIEAIISDCPDYHIAVEDNGEITARCSIWYNNTVQGEHDEKVGTLGHFEATDGMSAKAVIEKACEILKRENCVVVLGPMNQNTWKKYRFVTSMNDYPPFLLEPTNPIEYPQYFIDNGFKNYATYYSTLESPIQYDEEKCSRLLKRLSEENINIKIFDLTQFDEQLDIIYDLSLQCFQNNLLYTPLEKESFKQQYLAYKSYLIPELIFLAFENEKPIGFFFTIPNYNQKAYQDKIDTIIFKTIGVLPEYRQKRIGSAFFELARKKALELGFESSINALMYQENVSMNFSPNAQVIRTYNLYRKEL